MHGCRAEGVTVVVIIIIIIVIIVIITTISIIVIIIIIIIRIIFCGKDPLRVKPRAVAPHHYSGPRPSPASTT